VLLAVNIRRVKSGIGCPITAPEAGVSPALAERCTKAVLAAAINSANTRLAM